MKLDDRGDTLWTKTYDISNFDYGYCGKCTLEGTCWVGGYFSPNNNSGYDIFLLKIDNVGNFLLTKTFGGPKDDYAYSLTYSNDGGCVLVGNTTFLGNSGNNISNILLIKTDSDGKITEEK